MHGKDLDTMSHNIEILQNVFILYVQIERFVRKIWERDGKRQTAREREKERYRVYHKNGDNLQCHLQYNIAQKRYS